MKRFEKAIRTTLLSNKRSDLEIIIRRAIKISAINTDTLLLLFWNASSNNEFLFHLNDKVHPYLSDEMFILFAYWIAAISQKPNLVNSHWLHYCFSEKQAFLDRLLQKKFSKYFNVVYTGDKLSIEPIIPYELIYEQITKP